MLDNNGELVAYGVVKVHLVLPPCAKFYLRSTAVLSQIRSVIQFEAYHLR